MDKKLIVFAMVLSVTMSRAFAEEHVGDRNPLPQGTPTIKEKVITVPAGTKISAITTYDLNSSALLTGQTVTLALPEDFYHNGNLVAPKGSVLTGNIIEAARARQNNANGKLNIRFSLITTPYGMQIPIAAIIKTDDDTGVLVGGETSANSKEIAVVNKKSEQGLLKSVWNFGENVSIPIDTPLELVLTQPITVNPTVYSTDN